MIPESDRAVAVQSAPIHKPKKRRRGKTATAKEKEFAKNFVEQKGDLRKAGKLTYSPASQSIMPDVLKRPQVVNEISNILNEVGLDERSLALKIFAVLNSKLKGHKEENELKAIRMALELHGSFAPIAIEVKDNPYRHLTTDQLEVAIRKQLADMGSRNAVEAETVEEDSK